MTAITTPAALFVRRGRKTYPVSSLHEAAAKWNEFRDATHAGASKIGDGAMVVDRDGLEVARISYNGKVWPAAPWVPGMVPLIG